MNKKTLPILSLVIVGVSILVTAAGTHALFNSKKTVAANKFAAGTLDLDVTSSDNINQPIMIDNVGATGKITGSRSWKVKNIGTLPGKLIFNLANINNIENGCNQPEIEAEPSCQADNTGELGRAIKVTAIFNGTKIAESNLDNGNDFSYTNAPILESGDQADFTVSWEENSTGYGNEVQSDSVSFDMVFRFEQQ